MNLKMDRQNKEKKNMDDSREGSLPSYQERIKLPLKTKCAECFHGNNLFKTLIIVVCVGLVFQQISSSVEKLIDLPISTHAHFDFNQTILYPSITFCKEPAYKFNKLLEYGLYAHPRYTSMWRYFNFDNNSLDDVWEETTYNQNDMFVQYGFDGQPENVELRPTMGFLLGRCYTMTSKIVGTKAYKSAGFSVTLQHSAEDIATSVSTSPPGYRVYIHYTKEPFTEVTVYNGGQVDTLYVNVGETVNVKLKVDQYLKLSKEDNPCTHRPNYSANDCTTKYVWKEVSEEAGCSGPWIESDLPRCSNFTSMTNLIVSYMNTHANHDCQSCPRICNSYLYNGFVTDRQMYYVWDSASGDWTFQKTSALLQTNLYVYFNSMMVSVYQEQYNYDWNLFISDLGGSVGFLLGLSVVSLLQTFSKGWVIFIEPYITQKKRSKSFSSIETTNISTLTEDYLKKCNELNMKNTN